VRRRTTFLALAALLLSAQGVYAGDQRVIDAVRRGDRTAVQTLLRQHADVNARALDGATALHHAIAQDDLAVAALLIRSGAAVDAVNEYGVRPLSLAAGNGSAAAVEALLKAGARADGALPTGETALMTAARVGRPDPVRVLLAHGAKPNAVEPTRGQTALMWAVAEDHLDAVRVLIAAGADVNAKSTSGFSPIMFAARQGNQAMVETLIAAGANVNDTDAAGVGVLMVATVRGHAKLAMYLLDRGANPNGGTAGYTPLHWAAATVRIDEYAFSFGSRWNEWGVLGGLTEGRLDLVKALLRHGADPNARITREARSPNQCDAGCSLPRFSNEGGGYGRPGSTPFLIAASTADIETMRLLLEHGADPKAQDHQQTSALMLAVGQPFEHAQDPIPQATARTATAFVLGLGIDPNIANTNYGDTALHLAAYLGYEDVVDMLIKHGANVNQKNKAGATPLKVTEGGLSHNGLEFAAQPRAAAVLKAHGGTAQ
jgi:ankyrin repeat protein